jgi:glutamate synthase (NADPH/NADH) small chain
LTKFEIWDILNAKVFANQDTYWRNMMALTLAQLKDNFVDLHPPLNPHEAAVEADRCYFCYDAPCMTACPTSIDIPMFIRQISTGNPNGAARTILNQNIMGGMCARVCPTETLCEEVCVREKAEGKPVKIGLLQRYATDHLMAEGKQPFKRAKKSGKKVAVVGAGPAGLAAAHRLAMHGHAVTVFEARRKNGGLNEFGIAAYKSVDDFAQKEVDFILEIGGITIKNGKKLGKNLSLEKLQKDYDAVFLGVGLQGVNALGVEGENAKAVEDAVDYIADLRQSDDLSKLPVGKKVVVIGGGMTAIDVAVQSKLLGAEEVTVIYRRSQAQMNASVYEQELAKSKGVVIRHNVMPVKIKKKAGRTGAIVCEKTAETKGKLSGTGEMFEIVCDTVFKAIGQTYVDPTGNALKLEKGRIVVDAEKRTSLKGVWAGGDCIFGGKDLTVASVDDGRRAAESIHAALVG